jgi:hypothetical protein
MRAALILHAPLLIRLRFATDPSSWRPRYHPLRFARIIRFAPRRAARDARTVSRMPVLARRLEIADKAGHQALERLRAHRHDPRQRFAPDAAQNAPDAARRPTTSPTPAHRARRSAGAYGGARPDRRTSPHRRYAPGDAQNAPGASQKPAHRARRSARLARMVARVPTGVPARTGVTRQETPRTRQEPARSPHTARAGPLARMAARVPTGVPARTGVTRQETPGDRKSQPQAPTARYFASARSPIRSGFDCDTRAFRNCNSTCPSCARRRRRSASVIGCGRPAWSHRMHSSFVRVGFSFLLHVHAGRYGCSASGFHSLTSSRSRNRSSSVRE